MVKKTDRPDPGSERQQVETEDQATDQKAKKKKAQASDQAQDPQAGREVACENSESGSPITRNAECFEANERGDAILYCELHRGKLISDLATEEDGSWHYFDGVCWVPDDQGHSVEAVEGVIREYLRYRQHVIDQIGEAAKDKNKDQQQRLETQVKKIDRRIEKLRTKRGIQNTRALARMLKGGLGIKRELFDADPYLFNCGNGVLDLRSGLLRDGRPEEYPRRRTYVPYYVELVEKEDPAPVFLKATYQIFSEDWGMVKYVQKVFGSTLIGKNFEHYIYQLEGQGFNGKDWMIWCISQAMGEYAASVSAELLLDQGRSRSSSSPSPDILDMNKRRALFASETDAGRHASPSKIKLLSGDGELVGRGLQDKELTRFTPTHKLFLLTNSKPHAPADDFAFWERMVLIPFEISFVNREPRAENERRQDPTLKEKVREEFPGILAWLVQGCLLYQRDGLAPPPKVVEATAQYRRDEDLLADFIDECCVVKESAWAYSTDLYTKFSEWFTENVGKKPFSHRVFGRIIGKKFEKKKYDKIFYQGIGLKF